MKRILVTGGSGFIGRALVLALVEQGHDVTVLDSAWRKGTAGAAATVEGAALVSADIRDAEAVDRATAEREVVIHLAAIQGTQNFYRIPDEVLDVNVGGTLNLVRSAVRSGVSRIVFASSSEVYGSPARIPTPESSPLCVPDVLNPRFSYGGSKIIGELIAIHYARRNGSEATVLRYHNVYGPRMGWDHVIPQFILRLERREPFRVEGDGTQTRAFCYVDDAVDATVRATFEPAAAGRIFNVGNPSEERTIRELISALSEVSGVPITPVYGPAAEGGPARRCPDISSAEEALGYRPRVSLRDGLRSTYRWYVDAIRRGEATA